MSRIRKHRRRSQCETFFFFTLHSLFWNEWYFHWLHFFFRSVAQFFLPSCGNSESFEDVSHCVIWVLYLTTKFNNYVNEYELDCFEFHFFQKYTNRGMALKLFFFPVLFIVCVIMVGCVSWTFWNVIFARFSLIFCVIKIYPNFSKFLKFDLIRMVRFQLKEFQQI